MDSVNPVAITVTDHLHLEIRPFYFLFLNGEYKCMHFILKSKQKSVEIKKCLNASFWIIQLKIYASLRPKVMHQ
jgi:hypothetical protein